MIGQFVNPEDLYMTSSITFPDPFMANAFVDGLLNAGIQENNISFSGLCVTFSFNKSFDKTSNFYTRFWKSVSQKSNRFFCKLFLSFTKVFCSTEDRVLYLYYFLPFLFRKLLRLHRFDKTCHRKKRCMKKKKAAKLYRSSSDEQISWALKPDWITPFKMQ